MPRAFTEQEARKIRQQLRGQAEQLFATHGVVKTTVEQLATTAGIAKGSFYKFYPSKEFLYMELLEIAQDRIREPLLEGHGGERPEFERRIRQMFQALCDEPLIMLMGRETEFMTVTRKLPPDYLHQHQLRDRQFLQQIIERWNNRREPPSLDVLAARITLLVMLGIHRNFIGQRLFPHAVDAAVVSLADCLLTDDSHV